MAGSVNKVILVGNVGKDPEVRNTPGGAKVVNFTLATSENWTDRASGERKERTEWHRVVVWNEKLGEIIEKYVHKGSKVYVEGTLQTRKWTDQSGADKYTTEVVLQAYRGELTLLDSRNSGEGGGEGGGYQNRAPARQAPASAPPASAKPAGGSPSWDAPRAGGDLDDDIPF